MLYEYYGLYSLFKELIQMKTLYTAVLFSLLSMNTFGIKCNQVRNINTSELLIEYNNDDVASALFLRSPTETNYRKQHMNIQVVSGDRNSESEAFSATPNISSSDINWDNELGCFKEVGSQLYFNLFHSMNTYYVTIMPFYVKKFEGCLTPRNRPQQHELNCSDD